MKILIAAHQSGNTITGLGRYLDLLIEHLLRIDRKNAYTVLMGSDLSRNHPLEQLSAPNLERIRVPLRAGITPKHHWLIPRIMRTVKPDLFHYPHYDMTWSPGERSVVTIHDLKYLRHPEFFPRYSRVKRAVVRAFFNNTLRKAKAVIAVSEFTREDIVQLFPFARDKIRVVYHGVDAPRPDPLSPAPAEPYVLFVGERRPHKNLEILVQAHARLRERTPEIRLVIAGKSYGGYRGPEEAAASLKTSTAVDFRSGLSDSELANLYAGAKMLVLPSRYEGFGFPVVEAMALGIPVIASKGTCLEEIAGDAGILIDPDDAEGLAGAMARILDDRNLSEDLASRGRARAAEFTWRKAAEQTLETYESIAR